jgi:hypothetical protein
MAKSTTAMDKERPFKPSWVDCFNNWVKRLPIRAWIFFVVIGSALILVQMLPLWLEGGLQDICARRFQRATFRWPQAIPSTA